MRYCAVVPKEVVEYFGANFRSNPIGTGPFTLNAGMKMLNWYYVKIQLILNLIPKEKDSRI